MLNLSAAKEEERDLRLLGFRQKIPKLLMKMKIYIPEENWKSKRLQLSMRFLINQMKKNLAPVSSSQKDSLKEWCS